MSYRPLLGVVALSLVLGCAERRPADLAIRGATLIDGTGADPVPDANVVIADERIVCAGPASECPIPEGTEVIDGRGRWVTPGLIDAHVHFSQNGFIDARPLTVGRPVDERYERAIDDLRDHPERAFRAMLCSGITSVADVGGYSWTVELARRAETDSLAPRVAAAGPLLTFIRYPLEYRGEAQMVLLEDTAAVVEQVERIARLQPDYIKLWYIVDPRRGVDSTTARALAERVAREVHDRGLRLIVHATGLWEATHALEIGADVLVHSVFRDPVDDRFLELARERDVIYTPTIAVLEGYGYMSNGVFAADRYDLSCADPEIVERWRRWEAERQDVDREKVLAAVRDTIRTVQAVIFENLKRARDAGVTVALGTDSGNPMTFHGAAILEELGLMQRAGLTPMEVIVSATRNGARLLGRAAELGTLEPGKLADLLVLEADPLADLNAFSRIEWVVRGGRAVPRTALLPAEAAD
jgi:imidazolonepropionase-like amidohydrolase